MQFSWLCLAQVLLVLPIKTERIAHTVFYKQLSAIYETKNTYILIADPNQKIRESLVIDKTGFSSSSCDDFLRFLQKRVTIPIKS